MARVVSVGIQDFEKLISKGCFYVDKTEFIKDWWESNDEVTLITRPRRFGKTLNISMLERFLSIKHQGQGGLFQNLNIWKNEKYRKLQGTYPVIALSFAGIKENNYHGVMEQFYQILTNLYAQHDFLRDCGKLGEKDRAYFDRIGQDMSSADAVMTLHQLSDYLYRYYGKKVIILLDEYDTPMQEAYENGFWKELISFTRALLNNTFKTNPFLERAVMTGITKVGKESVFSDLNNLKAATMTSDKYASYFGFTEPEVFAAMDEYGMKNKDEVKRWYDGFTIGNQQNMYNPWSIINLLDEGKLKPYWANTSSNRLVADLLRGSDINLKMKLEQLLQHRSIFSDLDEEIAYEQLGQEENGIWSLLLACGYLTAVSMKEDSYELVLTNYEVEKTFYKMVKMWFQQDSVDYNGFLKALMRGDLEEMNGYMNRFALSMFGSFDGGTHPSAETMPERFYHGFVLGLLVDLAGRYEVTSNRESGLGRYDVMLMPLCIEDDGIIMEFKVRHAAKEKNLKETVQVALRQIEEKKYEQAFYGRGIEKERIRKYGFAFEGKKVLIGER